MINNLYAMAEAEHDYATREKLNWFIAEQVEEEETARELIDKFTLIGNDGMGSLYARPGTRRPHLQRAFSPRHRRIINPAHTTSTARRLPRGGGCFRNTSLRLVQSPGNVSLRLATD